jgi:putative hydrolase of the HAD superfamily
VQETWTTLPQFMKHIRGTDPALAIRPEAHNVITTAKRQGVKLAILSNELDHFYGQDFRAKLPLLRNFDLIVDATYTGILKPDPRAYAFVTDGLALPANACLFVDDQIRNVRAREGRGSEPYFSM